MTNQQTYKCPKCGNTHYLVDQMRATGNLLSKIFDIQNKKFITVSCSQCGYTEFYKRSSSIAGDVTDFFVG